jgi:hypothetical protein
MVFFFQPKELECDVTTKRKLKKKKKKRELKM